MAAQLLKESGPEGKVVSADRGSTKSVKGVAKMTFPGSVGEETDQADGEEGEKKQGSLGEKRELQYKPEPEGKRNRADEDAPKGNDVRSVREMASGEIGGEERRSIEDGSKEDEGREKERGERGKKRGERRERGFLGMEQTAKVE